MTHKLWNFIEFSDKWVNTDTSKVDDIAPSWFERKKVLQNNSTEYAEFVERLKREHAIETGVVERLYDIERGITHTLIQSGFNEAYLSHGDSSIPTVILMNHLGDHLNAVNFVFDVIANGRPLSISFIKELHSLVTQSQKTATGVDQFGHAVEIALERGVFKTRTNNPSRGGAVFEYCPPEHVDAEMENLISIYNDLERRQIHPIIIAAWFHHAFTQIHPFQDGNGRIVRLLASMILIKHNYFPFTVSRDDAKVKYINALEKTDFGQPQALVDYFSEVQRKKIEEALNLKDVSKSSLDQLTEILLNRLDAKEHKKSDKQIDISLNRDKVFEISENYLNQLKENLTTKLQGKVKVRISHLYDVINHDVEYAKQHNYYYNHTLPKTAIIFAMELQKGRTYELHLPIHHYGYDESTIAIGAILYLHNTYSYDIPPHIISLSGNNIESKEKNIKLFLDDVLSTVLAKIANEI